MSSEAPDRFTQTGAGVRFLDPERALAWVRRQASLARTVPECRAALAAIAEWAAEHPERALELAGESEGLTMTLLALRDD